MKVTEKAVLNIPSVFFLTFSNLHSASPRFSDAIVSQRDSSLIKFISNLEAMFEAKRRSQKYDVRTVQRRCGRGVRRMSDTQLAQEQ